MFDIKIGTLIPAGVAPALLPMLNEIGFESYEINMDSREATYGYPALAETLLPCMAGRPVSAIGLYGNTLDHPERDESVYAAITYGIKNAHLLHCDTIGIFAGAVPGRPMDESLPEFRKWMTPLCKLAEDHGVRLALENCNTGSTRSNAVMNIAINSDMWEKIFNEVSSPALGLEWEPAHAITLLTDPIPQLRKWAPKVFHVHGKDATLAWDVLRTHGLQGDQPYVWDRTPGYGDTNWHDVMTILLQNDYKGFVDIEGYHDPVFYGRLEWSAQASALSYLKDCRGGQALHVSPVFNGYHDRK